MNIDILGISELKWTGMGELNSDACLLTSRLVLTFPFCPKIFFSGITDQQDGISPRNVQLAPILTP